MGVKNARKKHNYAIMFSLWIRTKEGEQWSKSLAKSSASETKVLGKALIKVHPQIW